MEGFDKLTNSLIAARQVMNKVDNGSYSKGNIDTTKLSEQVDNATQTPPSQTGQMTSPNTNQRPVSANITEDKIKGSKLPDSIKKLMMENPIPTVDYTNELPSGFIDEVAKKMEQQSEFTSGGQRTNIKETVNTPQVSNTSINNDDLKTLIRETITETLDEIIESKVAKLMDGNKQIDENLQIRVGDSMFIGKLTDVRKMK